MVTNNVDYFNYVNNFNKISNISSNLIRAGLSKEKPIISIVIPTYKRAECLKDAIDSALNQSDFNTFEVIVIDNNPERNCAVEELISSYKDDKLFYYKNAENLGMFGNWNRGIELSNSNWIVLVHDDDVLSPYFLKYCFPYLSDSSVAILKPRSEKFATEIPKFSFPKQQKLLRKITLVDYLWGCAIGAPTNIIFNKEVVVKLGGFNQDYYPTSDYVFAAMCSQQYKVYKLPVVLGGYRVNDNASLSESTMQLFFFNRFYISSYIMRIFNWNNIIISRVQAYLIPKVTSITNKYYDVNFAFQNSNLELKDNPKYLNLLLKCLDQSLILILGVRRLGMAATHFIGNLFSVKPD